MAGTYLNTVTLSNFGSQNPFTLGTAGLVSVTSGDAIIGTNGYAWTVFNRGTVASSVGNGIDLTAGGLVVNGQSGSSAGLIAGTGIGVEIDQTTGTVINYGTIAATGNGLTEGIFFASTGTIRNRGTVAAASDVGVDLSGGGLLVNGQSGSTAGLITGGSQAVTIGGNGNTAINYGTIAGGGSGIGMNGTAQVVINSGTIAGTAGIGVSLYGGNLTNSAGASISGYGGGVSVSKTSGTLVNLGTIAGIGTGATGVALDGGVLNNATGAVIAGGYAGAGIGAAGTVVNAGTIKNTGTDRPALRLSQGGSIDNTGTIAGGSSGAYLTGAAVTVTNFGTISGIGNGVVGRATVNTVVNYGTISGTGTGGSGIYSVGGSVTNAQSGLIAGYDGGISTTGTIDNLGTIKVAGTSGSGVSLAGVLTNAAGGLIAGAGGYEGVGLGTVGTVINAGTIENTGTSGTGLRLFAGGSIDNTGTIAGGALGVYLNGTAGTVTNFGTIAGGANGVEGRATVNTVVNYGVISGTGTSGTGIFFVAGAITNTQTGVIAGYNGGVSTTGTLDNSGTIDVTGTSGSGVSLDGGILSNAAGGLIAGAGGYEGVGLGAAGAVVNAGTIENTATGGTGVRLFQGGSIDNTGRIAGGVIGVYLNGTTGSVTNFGTIVGAANGVEGRATVNTVVNSGVISGTGTSGTGIFFVAGAITNTQTGVIAGYDGGVSTTGTLDNSGTIEGTGTNAFQVSGVSLAGGILSNAAGGLIAGASFGVSLGGAGGTVTNAGTILGGGIGANLRASVEFLVNSGVISGTGTSGTGIYSVGGSVTNALGGLITGVGSGVDISGAAGAVTNYGTIAATGSAASAVEVRYGVFVNHGLVEGAASGIELGIGGPTGGVPGSGKVTVFGTVVGTTGISTAPTITAGYTVTVGGTVVGTAGPAVALAGGASRLIVDPGAAFSGNVDGGGGASVLEIAASGSGGAAPGRGQGSVAYVSLGKAVNFSALQIDPSATLDSSGTLSFDTLVNQGQINVASGDALALGIVASATTTGVIDLRAGGAIHFTGPVADQTLFFNPAGGSAAIDQPAKFAATVADFTSTLDTIDLTGLAFAGNTGVGFNAATNVLTVTEGGASATLQLDAETYTGISWIAQGDGITGTDIAVACFCRGTLILTERGEVAVENLAIDDRVMTLSGRARPVKWIGRRSYDGRFVAGNRAVLPIRVAAGALAEGLPARDLLVSPEHAFYIDGALAPARLLVNGASIAQVERVEQIDYFHIELDAHDIIFADGAPAETFVDCDNRFMFHNAGEFAALYPGDMRPAWEFCAPRLEAGSAELTAIRTALLQRAAALGHALDSDPDLHLVVDGAVVRPDTVAGGIHRFAIPAGSRAVWLASRSVVPAETTAASRDVRRLGVAVERIALGDGERSIDARHGDAALCDGFHEDEGSHRWTDGRARLPEAWLRSFPGGATLDVHLTLTELAYRLPPPARIGAAAA